MYPRLKKKKGTCIDATIDVLLLVHMSSNLVLECQILQHIESFRVGEPLIEKEGYPILG
jgi:hypothetical protein